MQSIIAALAALAALSPSSERQAQGTPPGVEAAPIPGAGSWMLQTRLPTLPGRVCTVRVQGEEASTTIILNNDGKPLIILARPDWNRTGKETALTVSIDGGAPIPREADMVANLVLVPMFDEGAMQQLRSARTLEWSLSLGRVRTNVTGLGGAYDALLACRSNPAG
jgi:hypothetical protein